MTDINDLVPRYADRRAGWVDRQGLVDALKADGVSIIEAIRILRTAFDVPLQNAKEICVECGHWTDQVVAAQPLLDDLEGWAADYKKGSIT